MVPCCTVLGAENTVASSKVDLKGEQTQRRMSYWRGDGAPPTWRTDQQIAFQKTAAGLYNVVGVSQPWELSDRPPFLPRPAKQRLGLPFTKPRHQDHPRSVLSTTNSEMIGATVEIKNELIEGPSAPKSSRSVVQVFARL
ncbi:hypothetical protein HRR86_008208 [Exophiala dermatitidis]|nr:hypothetical protein HRR82_009386 [Exophiala dermatitidis]KAJ4615263.1 hypothetical protein HRR86_008208 [Exophiala dermatitidis]